MSFKFSVNFGIQLRVSSTLLSQNFQFHYKVYELLTGLSIHGSFNDEVVPNAFQLLGADSDDNFLPSNSKYLF